MLTERFNLSGVYASADFMKSTLRMSDNPWISRSILSKNARAFSFCTKRQRCVNKSFGVRSLQSMTLPSKARRTRARLRLSLRVFCAAASILRSRLLSASSQSCESDPLVPVDASTRISRSSLSTCALRRSPSMPRGAICCKMPSRTPESDRTISSPRLLSAKTSG